jgi:hypothetical protein
MKRLLAIVVATVAAATVAAAITLPAGADPSAADSDAQFVSCLRSHGADIPAGTQGAAIKMWLHAHEGDVAAMAALKDCDANSPAPQDLVTCLRAHGLDVPSTKDELKAWIAQHADDANAKPAFAACQFSAVPPDKAGQQQDAKAFADCLRKNGADVPANLDGAELKTWVRDHASQDALKACGAVARSGPDCGPGKPAPAETKPAPTPSDTVGAETTTLTAQ